MSDTPTLDTADCCVDLEEARGVIRRLDRELKAANAQITHLNAEWTKTRKSDGAMMLRVAELEREIDAADTSRLVECMG